MLIRKEDTDHEPEGLYMYLYVDDKYQIITKPGIADPDSIKSM